MLRTYTPLRYPGGKAKLYPLIKDIIVANGLLGETYIEPFAGGSGLALKLLFNNDVRRIVINDFDPALYSLWHSILNHTQELCECIDRTEINVQEWERQREIYYRGLDNNIVEYGFSALYLNRTNVSGIISGGLIGGVSQTGNYLMNARFNKKTLIEIINKIASIKEQISLTNMDAKDFLKSEYLRKFRKVFIYCDPPYVIKGSKLYKNSFIKADHVSLSEVIKKCRRKWMVTYDICELVENLYSDFRRSTIDIHYSARVKRVAQEYAFFSNNLILPDNIKLDSKFVNLDIQ